MSIVAFMKRSVEGAAEPEIERLRWVFDEVMRMEQHWTKQLQDQQQRIATMLTVNGFLLAFLAVGGFGSHELLSGTWPSYFFLASVIGLCLALFMGLFALKPSIPISGAEEKRAEQKSRTRAKDPMTLVMIVRSFMQVVRTFRPKKSFRISSPQLWLDPHGLLELVSGSSHMEMIQSLISSTAQYGGVAAEHRSTLLGRRLWMYRQLAFLIVSLGMLIVALIGFVVTGS